mgnify:CR=1 FL=1
MSSISVIITCYNHGRYLGKAIQSVKSQGIDDVELIVVDDGSTDNTSDVASEFSGIQYLWQENEGLSSARNTGFHASRGEYVVFLDADDWLLPEALQTVAGHAEASSSPGILIGGHVKAYDTPSGISHGEPYAPDLGKDPYASLLQSNVVEMHAAVAYRRDVLQAINGFDETLPAAEDYDVLLRIARDYPESVRCYSEPVAAYRRHGANMTGNPALMLESTLDVLRRHRASASEQPAHRRALREGIRYHQNLFGPPILRRIKRAVLRSDGQYDLADDVSILAKYAPIWTMKQLGIHLARRVLPDRVRQSLREVVGKYVGRLSSEKVNLGDLRSTAPVNGNFGFDRGTPVDRYYIEQFLDAQSQDIKQRVLEIGERTYTERFGGDEVSRSDVLHYAEGNDEATIVGDLTDAPHISDDSFDCIILTETLQLIYDVSAALDTLHRILRPGGVLLITVPGITPMPDDVIGEGWQWSFTKNSLGGLLEESFPASQVEIKTYGNVLSAVAMLEGLTQEEFTTAELEAKDEVYPVTVTARVQKPA